MSRIQKLLIGTFVAVGVVAGSVTAIAQVAEEDAPALNARPMVETIDPSLAEEVNGLTRPRVASDALPADVASFVARSRPEGANPDLSRQALARNGRAVYLVPAERAVCLAFTDGVGGAAISCRSLSELKAGAVGPAVISKGCSATPDASQPPNCKGGLTLLGTVPDGVDRVAVELGDGEPVAGPVLNNAYLVDLPADRRAVALSYESPEGHVKFPISGASQ